MSAGTGRPMGDFERILAYERQNRRPGLTPRQRRQFIRMSFRDTARAVGELRWTAPPARRVR